MIGPTGVGKTEIARRLAKLCGAPFIKVEATKFTEVGYVGRDVESMVRDLMAAAVAMVKEEMEAQVADEAKKRAEDRLLDLLLPGITASDEPIGQTQATVIVPSPNAETREKFRTLLREGKLDSREVEISSPRSRPSDRAFCRHPIRGDEHCARWITKRFWRKKKKKWSQ